LMRVLNVNSYLDLKNGGGTAERTFQMSRFLARKGVQCTVLTLDLGLDRARITALAPAAVVALACLWKRFFVPRINWNVLRRLVREADIIHLMGHWSVLNAMVYLAARRAGKPYVVCPAGALPLFGRSAQLKRLYNLMIGNAIVRNASAWIAVTPAEFAHFESYGIQSARVTVIPNGVCEEDFVAADVVPFLRRHRLPTDAPLILFMGRLNPIKGPDLLLQAFSMVRDRLPNHHLVFAGPDGGLLSELSSVTAHENLNGRVHFIGYVDGADKVAAYRCACLLVVSSRQEAMSIVALEAGICGIPALLTDQCGFNEIRLIHAGLEVPATADGIANGLINLLRDPDVLHQVAPAWRDFVERRYSWNAIVPQYLDLYRGILARDGAK
jgi:glycosyltransferase involved in cell wall biosynthesis